MSVLIIGIVTITALVWGIALSLANEADAEKRRAVHRGHSGDKEERTVVQIETLQAA